MFCKQISTCGKPQSPTSILSIIFCSRVLFRICRVPRQIFFLHWASDRQTPCCCPPSYGELYVTNRIRFLYFRYVGRPILVCQLVNGHHEMMLIDECVFLRIFLFPHQFFSCPGRLKQKQRQSQQRQQYQPSPWPIDHDINQNQFES